MSRNRFIQHIQIIEDTETSAKFVIDNPKVAGIVTGLLNKLSDENYKLKDDLKECRIRKDIIKEKLVPYHMICDKYHLASSVKLEEYIEKLRRKNRELLNELNSMEDENTRKNNTIRKQQMALCDFNNRETAIDKWGDKRPEFNLDKYYEVCMEEIKQTILKSELKNKINQLISECEQGIEETINGEKDSYIVKHDIAIQMLKKLLNEI